MLGAAPNESPPSPGSGNPDRLAARIRFPGSLSHQKPPPTIGLLWTIPHVACHIYRRDCAESSTSYWPIVAARLKNFPGAKLTKRAMRTTAMVAPASLRRDCHHMTPPIATSARSPPRE